MSRDREEEEPSPPYVENLLPPLLALDLLQPMRKVEEGRVGGSFLVVREHETPIVMHALANKAATKVRFKLFLI